MFYLEYFYFMSFNLSVISYDSHIYCTFHFYLCYLITARILLSWYLLRFVPSYTVAVYLICVVVCKMSGLTPTLLLSKRPMIHIHSPSASFVESKCSSQHDQAATSSSTQLPATLMSHRPKNTLTQPS